MSLYEYLIAEGFTQTAAYHVCFNYSYGLLEENGQHEHLYYLQNIKECISAVNRWKQLYKSADIGI